MPSTPDISATFLTIKPLPNNCDFARNIKNKSIGSSSFSCEYTGVHLDNLVKSEWSELPTSIAGRERLTSSGSGAVVDQVPQAGLATKATYISVDIFTEFYQVWSLTQYYSVEISQSRISVKKCVFNKRTIKVCVSCC